MRKKYNGILKKNSLDSILGYVFIAFLLISLLLGFPGLPDFVITFGHIFQIILGVLFVIGIVTALINGVIKLIADKKQSG